MSILKWQRVIDESVFSDGDLYLIAVESPQYRDRDLLDTKQFAAVGQKFFALATDLDRSFERWLQNWLNTSYGESDCVVPTDWEDWLATRTQQYVSVAFLDKYSEKKQSNNYPSDHLSNTAVPIDNGELELDVESVLSISHTEEVELWTSLVEEYLKQFDSASFSELKQNLELTPAEIYLGVLLNEEIQIIPNSYQFKRLSSSAK